jgi:uncharacterized membrane protein
LARLGYPRAVLSSPLPLKTLRGKPYKGVKEALRKGNFTSVMLMVSYRWLNFIVLFVGIFTTNHLALTARKPLAASATFIIMVVSVYLLEKFYNGGPEKIVDERTELIRLKSIYYGSFALLVALMLELIWLVSEDYETAVLMTKYLLMPCGVMIAVLLISKAYLERVR